MRFPEIMPPLNLQITGRIVLVEVMLLHWLIRPQRRFA
jgi:hypothetical protein